MNQDIVSSLIQMLQSNNVTDAAAQKLGISSEKAGGLVQQALPLLFGALERNAQSEEGAASLMDALQKDHDGSILSHLGDIVTQSDELKGGKILQHIFGGKEEQVVGMLGQKSAVDATSVSQLLQMLAPAVMGMLGQEQKSGHTGGNIAGFLQANAGGETDLAALATKFLDQDGDGGVVDDLWAMGKRYFS